MSECVYLIACDTAIGRLHKIGIANNPDARLEQIKKEMIVNPEDAETAIVVDWFSHEKACEIESELHVRYRDFNFRFPLVIRGREWFYLNEDQVETLLQEFSRYKHEFTVQPPSRLSQSSPTFIPIPVGEDGKFHLTNEQLDSIFPPERQKEFVEGLIKLAREKQS